MADEERKEHPGGRPCLYTKNEIDELAAKFEQYIAETDIPIVAEFAYQNNIDRTLLYDRPELSTLTKRCIAKKEAQLEKLALARKIDASTAIFSLKQLGWRDKHEITTPPGQPIEINSQFNTATEAELTEILSYVRQQRNQS